MTTHTVRQGDCMNSIAFRYGFFPDTLWEHADNRELKELRKADNVLLPGDLVHIPELTERTESGASEALHRFRRRGVPAVLRIVFTRRKLPEPDEAGSAPTSSDPSVYESTAQSEPEPEFEPLASTPYVITGDVEAEGISDGEGRVEIPVRPDALTATILFQRGTPDEMSFQLALGHLDPVDVPSGLSQRLNNLGYACTADAQEIDSFVKAALSRFQTAEGLEASGEPDSATCARLVEVHGS